MYAWPLVGRWHHLGRVATVVWEWLSLRFKNVISRFLFIIGVLLSKSHVFLEGLNPCFK